MGGRFNYGSYIHYESWCLTGVGLGEELAGIGGNGRAG